MAYRSEAEAYQAIRREWKHRRNSAQRDQTYWMWQVKNKEVHPHTRGIIAKIMQCLLANMPLDIDAQRKATQKQAEVSKYQHLLNRYKLCMRGK
jgi:hypothetical protein